MHPLLVNPMHKIGENFQFSILPVAFVDINKKEMEKFRKNEKRENKITFWIVGKA